MKKFSIQAKRIAARYLIEKAAYLNDDECLEDENFECWKGWHQDRDDFIMWASEANIEQNLHAESWRALQCLMGK